MKDSYYILTDVNSGLSYVSACLSPFSAVTGKSTDTLRRWLYKPETALKQGYSVTIAEYLKSKQGGNRK